MKFLGKQLKWIVLGFLTQAACMGMANATTSPSTTGTSPSKSTSMGVFELGGTFSYTKSTYDGASYTSSRGYGVTFGYYLTADSELQFVFQDTINRNYLAGSEDLTYHDQTYSINMSYFLFTDVSTFRPYLKFGVGELNRQETGSYSGSNGVVYAPPAETDSITVIAGVGVKMKLGSHFGIKGEANTYMTGGSISTWAQNVSVNLGASIYF